MLVLKGTEPSALKCLITWLGIECLFHAQERYVGKNLELKYLKEAVFHRDGFSMLQRLAKAWLLCVLLGLIIILVGGLASATSPLEPLGEPTFADNGHVTMTFRIKADHAEVTLPLIEQPDQHYSHISSGLAPRLDSANPNYSEWVRSYISWVEKSFSQPSTAYRYQYNNQEYALEGLYIKPGENRIYKHEVEFKIAAEEETRTLLVAQRYLKLSPLPQGQLNGRFTLHPLTLSIAHKPAQTSIHEDMQRLYVKGNTLYRPATNVITYERPAIEGIAGFEIKSTYERRQEPVLDGREVKTLAMKMTTRPQTEDIIREGYYHVRAKRQQNSPYIYSNGNRLFLVRVHELECYREHGEPISYFFLNAEQTNHEIFLKPHHQLISMSSAHDGFLPEGLYQAYGRLWVKVDQRFNTQPHTAFTLKSSDGQTSFIQNLHVDTAITNCQLFQDLRASAFLTMLNLSGRVFKTDEQESLKNLLPLFPQLEALNLAKDDREVRYSRLMATIGSLTSLTSLNLSGAMLDDFAIEPIKALTRLKELDVSHNPYITVAGAVSLKTLQCLDSLSFYGCNAEASHTFETILHKIPRKMLEEYIIPYSCLLNAEQNSYLERKYSTPPDSSTTFTLSLWYKRPNISHWGNFFAVESSAETLFCLRTCKEQYGGNTGLTSAHSLDVRLQNKALLDRIHLQNDSTQWIHLVVNVDAKVEKKINFYSNGSLRGTVDLPPSAVVGGLGQRLCIGHIAHKYVNSTFDGYIADVYGIDGQCLPPTVFGVNKQAGQKQSKAKWAPTDYKGSYGKNGFHLTFSDPQALGKDSSGNNNHWISHNLPSSQSYDTPTNSMNVLKDIQAYCIDTPAKLTCGNMVFEGDINRPRIVLSHLRVPDGKRYAEFTLLRKGTGTAQVGIINNRYYAPQKDQLKILGEEPHTLAFHSDGKLLYGCESCLYGEPFTTEDTISIATDLEEKKVWFAKNGIWLREGDPARGLNAVPSWDFQLNKREVTMSIGSSAANIPAKWQANFGQRSFKYHPPEGFISFSK